MTSGQPMTSIGYELIVISACVLGGVSLKGGIGKISYVVAGILILGTVGKCDEPAEYLAILTIRRARGDPAGGGDLRPLQTKKPNVRPEFKPNFFSLQSNCRQRPFRWR